MPTSAEVEGQLTGPGAPFEVVTEQVNGVPTKVFKQRMRSLRDIAALAALKGDEEPLIVHRGRRVGFASFVGYANVVSATLAGSFGLQRGDRVAVLSPNNLEWCLSFWGAVDAGLILVGLNGWWKNDEITFGLRDSGARVLVADRNRFARIANRVAECPELEAVFLIDADAKDWPDTTASLHHFEELLDVRGSDSVGLPAATIAEDDPAVIFYTSGTTGRPKGAVSTHRSMIANLQNTFYAVTVTALTVGSDEPTVVPSSMVALLTSPLFHVSGCHSGLVVGLAAGMTLVIPDGRFEPQEVMRLMDEERVTTWATVPTMVWRVVEHPQRHNYDLSSVTTVSYGGSPSAAELQRRVRETFPNVKSMANAYGLTESSSVVTVNSGPDLVERPDSVGRVMPVVEVRIVSEDGKDVATGQSGEVWVKGPIIMPGYWNDPRGTDEVLKDGWLHTGDVGCTDRDGFLYITDRAKDMIIRGGENVYCVEIENRLVEHPGIAEAAVVGVPHKTLGEEVKAVVRVEDGATLTKAEVREWVACSLADFKVPAHVELTRDLLPRNASGKLLKNVLRGEGEVSLDETM